MGSRSKIHKVGVHFDKHSQYLGNWKDNLDNNNLQLRSSETRVSNPIAPVQTRNRKNLPKNTQSHSPQKRASFSNVRYLSNISDGLNNELPLAKSNSGPAPDFDDKPLPLKCYSSEPTFQPLLIHRTSSVDSYQSPFSQSQFAPSSFSDEHQLNLLDLELDIDTPFQLSEATLSFYPQNTNQYSDVSYSEPSFFENNDKTIQDQINYCNEFKNLEYSFNSDNIFSSDIAGVIDLNSLTNSDATNLDTPYRLHQSVETSTFFNRI